MTTYIDGKAVGIGTIRAEIGVTGNVLHDDTLVGNGNTDPLGVNTANIVSQQMLANTISVLNTAIDAQAEAIAKTRENSVKKSGDTMTGILTIMAEDDYDPSTPAVGGLSFKSNASPEGYTNRMRQVGVGGVAIEYLLNGRQYANLVFTDQEIFLDNTENGTGNPTSLGTKSSRWTTVYSTKLNNGADLIVPTEGGTLARIEDLQNATTTLNAGIAGNAQAIQKTREDYIQADSEIHQILNNHAGELTTLRGNQASLGDQVLNIESKIPQSASGSNPLITKQQLLDEEMDIREDLNETSSELQTQITAQATEVNKLKEAIAGLGSLSYSVVDVLPEVGEKGVIYLVPKDGEQPDVHDEYLWIDGQFELIGTTQIDLSNYVQKTDIATSSKPGLLLGTGSGFRANIYGMPQCDTLTATSYKSVNDSYFISKGSIENIKDDIVKRAVTANSIPLTDEEKTSAKNWLGVAESDIDLSNYVQKTDYASSKAAGLVKGYNANAFSFVPDTGQPYCENKSLASYNSAGGNLFIGKGTLENIKYSYVRDGIAKNTYSLSGSEKEKVRNWIGAGEPTVFDVMPDIYASVGKIYQYAGETTEEFTKGYFYTAVSQGLSYMPSDSNITFDFDLFWSELESAGVTLDALRLTEMDKERGGFSIIGTVESVTNYRVQDINGTPLDVLLTQSIRSTSEYVGMSNRWYYKPAETFAWERVDVQPAFGGATLPTEDGSYVLKCVVADGVPTVSWVKE